MFVLLIALSITGISSKGGLSEPTNRTNTYVVWLCC